VDLAFGRGHWLGVRVIGFDEGIDGLPELLTKVKEAPCIDFVSRIENQIFARLSQETGVGVKWKTQVQMT
jgi:hypothetical protein